MPSLARSSAVAATPSKSIVLGCLNAAIDGCGLERKALASDLGQSEQTFSKMTSGVQAFGLLTLERCPEGLLLDFLKRWGRERGFTVELINTDQRLLELLELFEKGASALVLLQRQREMRADTERRRA